MAVTNPCGPCGGSPLDRFESLFTCSGVCSDCKWINPRCCNTCYDTNTDTCKNGCLDFYDINMIPVIQSKIKSFGYCDNFKALGIQFTNGCKKIYMNVDKEIYERLLDLNKDLLYMFLEDNIDPSKNQCINIT